MTGSAEQAGRLDWVDGAKAVSIILVVMMHATLGTGEAMGGEGWLHPIVAWAQPFRMPLFFLLAGLFAARVLGQSWPEVIGGKVLHFLYLYLLWVLIQCLVKCGLAHGAGLDRVVITVLWSLVEPYGTLWFIHMLAVMFVAVRLLARWHPAITLAVAAILNVASLQTGWLVIDEFAARFVFFVAGLWLAPGVFVMAEEARLRPRLALALAGAVLAAIAFAVVVPTTHPRFVVVAQLPLVALLAGFAGALAVIAVVVVAMAGSRGVALLLSWVGARTLAIYLMFFLPMAAARSLLVKTGIVTDVGQASLLVTLAAVVVPLVLHTALRRTPARVLFERPAWLRLEPAAAPPSKRGA